MSTRTSPGPATGSGRSPYCRTSGPPCCRKKAAFSLPRERIGAKLDVHRARLAAFAAFHQPRRAVAARAPQPAAFPAGVRIVDAPVESLGVNAHRVWNAQQDHPAVLQCHEAVVEVGGRHRDVLAQAEGIVLVHPCVIARLGAVLAQSAEAWPWVLVERPPLRAMVPGGLGAVQRALALAPVEADEMAARARAPQHAVPVNVSAAYAVAGRWHVEHLGKLGLGIEAQKSRCAGKHAHRVPDRTI